MVDPSTGDSISLGFFDSEESVRAAERNVGRARERLGLASSPPDDVQVWRVVEHTLMT